MTRDNFSFFLTGWRYKHCLYKSSHLWKCQHSFCGNYLCSNAKAWSQRKARDTAPPCIRRFWSPFFTLWLLLQVLINSGAHAARMHFPGGEENIQGEKKRERRKDNHQPKLPLLRNNPAEGVQIMLLMNWLAASETFHSERHPYASDHQFVNQFIRQLNVP